MFQTSYCFIGLNFQGNALSLKIVYEHIHDASTEYYCICCLKQYHEFKDSKSAAVVDLVVVMVVISKVVSW